MSLCWNGMPSAFCSLVPNTFKGFQTSIRGLHHADGFTIPATPDGVGTAEERRKQPMQTLIVDRCMLESEFSKLRRRLVACRWSHLIGSIFGISW